MAIPTDSDFWEDLLVFIEQGKVIPVIGEAVVTFGPDNQNLYGWLAKSLAEKLQVPPDSFRQRLLSTTLSAGICSAAERGMSSTVDCNVFSATSALSPAPLCEN